LTAEQALQEARAADADLARGHWRGPLYGVPFTVKDWINAAGLPCTDGGLRFHRSLEMSPGALCIVRCLW